MALNYVKFLRGTVNAYNNLRTKDNNTLYFVYQNNEDDHGSLYLGTKLISKGEVSFSDLTDISLTDIQDGQILIYDAEAEAWKNINLSDAIADGDIDIGGTPTISEVTLEDGETDEDGLATIEDPKVGDIVFIGDNVYIYDGSEWRLLNPQDNDLWGEVLVLKKRVGNPRLTSQEPTGLYLLLEEKINEQRANELIEAALANLNLDSLTYRKVNNIEDIDLSEDKYIYLVPVNPDSENNKYDEYLVIDGKLECIGHLGGDIATISDVVGLEDALNDKADNDDLVALETRVGNLEDILNDKEVDGEIVPGLVSTVDDLQNDLVDLSDTVGDLSDLIDYDPSNPTNVVQEINILKQMITWGNIGE